MKMHWKILGGLLGLVLMMGGCAETHQVKNKEIQTGFLTNSYPLLSPGGEGQASMRYIKPGTNWKKIQQNQLGCCTGLGGTRFCREQRNGCSSSGGRSETGQYVL